MIFLQKAILFSVSVLFSFIVVNSRVATEGQIIKTGSKVLADPSQGYVPPRRGRSSRTEGAGSRGCDLNTKPISLKLLAPEDHVGATISAYPTFVWYVSTSASQPIHFTLVEPGVAEPLWEERVEVTRPGLIALKLPHEAQPLEFGKEYRWYVGVQCNPRRPSENIYGYAWIKLVKPSPELERELTAITDLQKRSLTFAKSSVWYDAVSSMYNFNDQQNSSDFAYQLYRLGLLESKISF